MRKILFRGKTYTGEWMYGTPLRVQNKNRVVCCIVPEDAKWGEKWPEVIPDTIGEFTGTTDINGVKIFEGDIVTCDTFCVDGNEFRTSAKMPVVWDGNAARFAFVAPSIDDNILDDLADIKWTIVGNVYDNVKGRLNGGSDG